MSWRGFITGENYLVMRFEDHSEERLAIETKGNGWWILEEAIGQLSGNNRPIIRLIYLEKSSDDPLVVPIGKDVNH